MEGCGRGGGGGPINPSSPFDGGEQLDVKYHPEPSTSTDFFTAATLGGLDDTMPFLQLLQTLYPNNNIHSPLNKNNQVKAENKIDSCITNDMQELHSPVMSEAKKLTQVAAEEEEEKREFKSVNECINDFSSDRIPQLKCSKMRKPKRVKEVVENKKDAEKQRMTHIAVERNRRRQMSEYLGFLRSLLPPAYAAKGDQASIVGGVIDYVKKLEQHLQTLQAKKRQKKMDEVTRRSSKSVPMSFDVSTSSSSSSASLEDDADKKPQLEKKADINIMVVQTHVTLHIECDDMKQNQLIKFLVALENLGLTILHLNITTSIHKSSFYSLSLKVEDECKVRSAEEISGSVEKVLNSLNICNGARSSVRNQNQDDDDDARNGRDE